MASIIVNRYWFIYGNYDGYYGRWDCPPISAIGAASRAYERGQEAARKGRFYPRHFFN